MSDPAEELDLLAAEYVLGTLDAPTAQEIAMRAQTDPALASAIAAWEKRLAPLSSLVAPAEPHDSLWRRLDASVAAHVTASPASGLSRAWRSVVLWRWSTAAAVGVAAALAAFLWLRPLPPHPVAALVPVGSAAAAYVVELEPNGTLRILALRTVSVAIGKDLALWALSRGAPHPIELGLLPASGRILAVPKFLMKGTELIITLEPKGGSPTGSPAGPVLFTGTLEGAD